MKKATERRLVQRLHGDDQKLAALQRLVLPRHAIPRCEIDWNQNASRLVDILVDFTCEETQSRLDRIYMQQLHEHAGLESGTQNDPSTYQIWLQSDLDVLYTEIRDVVTMSVSHPLRKSLQEDWRRERLASQFVR